MGQRARAVKLAALYDGAVSVTSEPDRGSVFTVTLFDAAAPDDTPSAAGEAADTS